MYNFAALKYVVQGSEYEIMELVRHLIISSPEAPNGSSFAVTPDGAYGLRKLYLTETSRQSLISSGATTDDWVESAELM